MSDRKKTTNSAETKNNFIRKYTQIHANKKQQKYSPRKTQNTQRFKNKSFFRILCVFRGLNS
jgi:hypothetical protein